MAAGKRILKKQRKVSRALIALLVVILCAGGALAYLSLSSGSVSNTFTPDASVNPAINEVFEDNTKENVSVTVGETGYSVYVRAVVVATWEDDSGNVLAAAPVAGEDYSITYNMTSGWFQKDGYWYYSDPVASGGTTGTLITECKPLKAAPESGYTLSVKIAAQTIQAAGTTDGDSTPLVTAAWDVEVDENGKLSAGS